MMFSQWLIIDTYYIQATYKGPDQTKRMRRLIWGSAGRTYYKTAAGFICEGS